MESSSDKTIDDIILDVSYQTYILRLQHIHFSIIIDINSITTANSCKWKKFYICYSFSECFSIKNSRVISQRLKRIRIYHWSFNEDIDV